MSMCVLCVLNRIKEDQEKIIKDLANEIRVLQRLESDYKENGEVEELHIARETEYKLLCKLNEKLDNLKSIQERIELEKASV